MTMSAEDFDTRNDRSQETSAASAGPVVEKTAWGYIIRESHADRKIRIASSIAGRFFGAILLLAAAGLWVMPDSVYGGELMGMKLAAMVMFTVLGGYFIWVGRHVLHPEFRFDLKHREIRIGQRLGDDTFRQSSRIDFDNVSSVFLLRSKEYRPTRLFLRLADLDTGIEIATGHNAPMESLKQRLADDLTGQARRPVARQLDRHQRVAA